MSEPPRVHITTRSKVYFPALMNNISHQAMDTIQDVAGSHMTSAIDQRGVNG